MASLPDSAARCAPTRRTSGSTAGRAPGQAAKRAQRTACGSAHSAASTRGCARPNWLAPEARPDLDFGAAGAALPGPRVVVWRASSSAQAAEGVPASTRAPPAGVTLRVACGTVLLQRWLPYAAQLSEHPASSAVSVRFQSQACTQRHQAAVGMPASERTRLGSKLLAWHEHNMCDALCAASSQRERMLHASLSLYS